MEHAAVAYRPVIKVNGSGSLETDDILAAEEPLEIRLGYRSAGKRVQKAISVTMRTPGHDFELAAGFLYTEGIIGGASAITSMQHCAGGNVARVELDDSVILDPGKLDRHFYTTSSCGVCGKSSIEAVRTVCPAPPADTGFRVTASLLYQLPHLLRGRQEVFDRTGGLHASALFDADGNLLLLREDVGRHNALDKIIGAALEKELLPLQDRVLLLSGRASFELLQKAAMAGIMVVAAVGAPSTLAVQMAEESGITLVGFLSGARFNIYSGAQRVII